MVDEMNYCGGLLSKGLEEKAKASGVIDVRRYVVRTVMTLSFRTDRSGQIVQTQIRLLID